MHDSPPATPCPSDVKHQSRSPHEIKPILAVLAEEGTVLLGGQSVNIWSLIYAKRSREPWRSSQPYTSVDVDSLGDRLEMIRVGKSLETCGYTVEAYFPTPQESGTPNTGKLVVKKGLFSIVIDFLHTVRGLDAQEIRAHAAIMVWEGLSIRILSPILCVESKLYNLLTLPQDDPREPRQDRKHLILSIANLREHLLQQTKMASTEALTQTAQRLVDVAIHQEGLEIRRRINIDLLDGIPWRFWRKCPVVRLRKFAAAEKLCRQKVMSRLTDMEEIEIWLRKLKVKNLKRRPHS